jgi:hypothetical protein
VPEIINLYCDESCHLLHDQRPVMVLGAIWCPQDHTREIASRLREIKVKHGLAKDFEVKWNKVSPAKKDFYLDLLNYFFDDDHLHFRGWVAHKDCLRHEAFSQTHDDWYYKMMFGLLSPLLNPNRRFRIYLDRKIHEAHPRLINCTIFYVTSFTISIIIFWKECKLLNHMLLNRSNWRTYFLERLVM